MLALSALTVVEVVLCVSYFFVKFFSNTSYRFVFIFLAFIFLSNFLAKTAQKYIELDNHV